MSNRFPVGFRLLPSDWKIHKTVARIVWRFTFYKITTLRETTFYAKHIITYLRVRHFKKLDF